MSFGNVPVDAGSVPIAETYVPGTGFVALQGSTNTNTDGSSNKSAPANFNLTQINSLAINMAGTDGDTPNTLLEIVPGLYNGATIDQQRGNLDNITLLSSGATTTTNGNTADLTNYNARGVKVYIKTGSFGASESTMVVNVQIKDPVGGTYYTVLSSASLAASSTYVLTVYPGMTASANVMANDAIPRTWRVSWTASNWGTGGSTLGISCAYII